MSGTADVKCYPNIFQAIKYPQSITLKYDWIFSMKKFKKNSKIEHLREIVRRLDVPPLYFVISWEITYVNIIYFFIFY